MQQFLELTIAGPGKKLYIPAASVLTYECVPEGKNEHFPEEGSFLRFDYGEGVTFALVVEKMDQLKKEIGTDGFLALHLIDDAELFARRQLVIAMQEKEDDGIEATQLSLAMGGQVGSLFVKDTFVEINQQLAG